MVGGQMNVIHQNKVLFKYFKKEKLKNIKKEVKIIMKKDIIIIVDDNSDYLDSQQNLLRIMGYSVSGFLTLKDAIEACNKLASDEKIIFLLDIIREEKAKKIDWGRFSSNEGGVPEDD